MNESPTQDDAPAHPTLHRSSSTYLLITPKEAAESYDLAFPRPKGFFLIPMLALCDLISAVVFAVLLSKIDQGREASWLLAWNHARALVLVAIGVSRRIRERAWVVGTCCIITLLLLLFYSNALVQHLRTDEPSKYSTLFPIYLLSQLFFSIAHWLCFVLVIGIRRAQNPFGLGYASYHYRERLVDVDEESIADAMGSEDEDSLSEDENEIIDIEPVVTPATALDAGHTMRSRMSSRSLQRDSMGSPVKKRLREGYETFGEGHGEI